MAGFAVSKMACTTVLLVCMLVCGAHVYATNLTCAEVTTLLTPCITYGIFGGMPAPACCEGMKTLNVKENTTEDRRNACSCIMEGVSKIPGISYENIGTLPDKCGVTCPYKITPTTDCSKVE